MFIALIPWLVLRLEAPSKINVLRQYHVCIYITVNNKIDNSKISVLSKPCEKNLTPKESDEHIFIP